MKNLGCVADWWWSSGGATAEVVVLEELTEKVAVLRQRQHEQWGCGIRGSSFCCGSDIGIAAVGAVAAVAGAATSEEMKIKWQLIIDHAGVDCGAMETILGEP